MNVTLARADLLPALGAAAGVVERRQTLPILANVLLTSSGGVVALRATDLELEINASAVATVREDGAVTVPARKLLDICRALPEGSELNVRKEGERVVVQSGRSRFLLSSLPAEDFPKMEIGGEGVTFVMEEGCLRRVLEKCSFAMAQQDVRYYLNGVLFELSDGQLVVVATDGHRLAKVSTEIAAMFRAGQEPMQFIVPGKAVAELKRLLASGSEQVELTVSQRTLHARLSGKVLSTKLIDAKYPEYERVIPSGLEKRALVDRELLRGALQRTAILTNEKYKGARVNFSNGVLGLRAHNPEKEEAQDELEIKYEGEGVEIGFNISYVLDVIGAIGDGEIEVLFRDGDSSAVWRGASSSDETYVIMPMRL